MARLPANSLVNKVPSVFLALVILGAVSAIIYIAVFSKSSATFTEFYILGPEGKAADYPTVLTVGQPGRVIVGIINQEQQTASYRVELRLEGTEQGEIGPVVLEHQQQFEQSINFISEKAGKQQRLEFLLYKDGQRNVYQSLRLFIEVKE